MKGYRVNKMKYIFPLLATLLIGCVPIVEMNLNSQDKIKVVYEIGDEILLKHTGITIFGNSSNKFSLSYSRRDAIEKTMIQKSTNTLVYGDKEVNSSGEYYLTIKNGTVCSGPSCESIPGTGVYGNALNKYARSSVTYEISDQVKYTSKAKRYFFKNINVYVNKIDPSKLSEEQINSLFSCLDRENISVAMQYMNQLRPLFKVETTGKLEGGLSVVVESKECNGIAG